MEAMDFLVDVERESSDFGDSGWHLVLEMPSYVSGLGLGIFTQAQTSLNYWI